MDCLLPPPTVIPVGKFSSFLVPYQISAFPRLFLVPTQTDPPRLLHKNGGGNIPQTILTNDSINYLCFIKGLQSPPPPSAHHWATVELLLRPGGQVFVSPFSRGGGLGGEGSQGTNSPPPLERFQFPPLVNCCVNTPNSGWVYLHLSLQALSCGLRAEGPSARISHKRDEYIYIYIYILIYIHTYTNMLSLSRVC